MPFPRVLFALGIRHVGETVARTIVSRFKSLDELMQADIDTHTGIREIGPKIAASIISYFGDPENIEIIKRLRSKGINMGGQTETTPAGTALKDKSIVISGVFAKHSREEYAELIERNGGRNSSSVSRNTSFILAGENMGPSKREKAEELDVPLMNEDEFLKIIGEE